MVIRFDYDEAAAEGRAPRATDRVTVLHGDINPSLLGYGPDAEAVDTIKKIFPFIPVKLAASSCAPIEIELSKDAKEALDNLGKTVAFDQGTKQITSYLGLERNDVYDYGSKDGHYFSYWEKDAIESSVLIAGLSDHTDVYVSETVFKHVDDQGRTKILEAMANEMTKTFLRETMNAVAYGIPMSLEAHSVARDAEAALFRVMSDFFDLDRVVTWAQGIPEGYEANVVQKSLAEQRQRVPVNYQPPPDPIAGKAYETRPWDPNDGVPKPTAISKTVTMPPVTETTNSQNLDDYRKRFNTKYDHLRKYVKEQLDKGEPTLEAKTTRPCTYLDRELGNPVYVALNNYFSTKEGEFTDCFKDYRPSIKPDDPAVTDGRIVSLAQSTNAFRSYELSRGRTVNPITSVTSVKIHIAKFPAEYDPDWLASLQETVSSARAGHETRMSDKAKADATEQWFDDWARKVHPQLE